MLLEKDKYWNSRWDRNCHSDCFLAPWVYSIKDKITTDWNTYFYANKINVTNVDDFYKNFFDYGDTVIEDAKLDFTWTYQYYTWNSMEYWSLKTLLDASWVKFYRVLRVYWTYCKNSSSISDSSCSNASDPKELRFCVKVYFRSRWEQDVELCSIMTNFEK